MKVDGRNVTQAEAAIKRERAKGPREETDKLERHLRNVAVVGQLCPDKMPYLSERDLRQAACGS